MSWPGDGEPRFIVTSVSGFELDPTVGRPGTSSYSKVPISYQVLDRAYAHALVREFPPKRGGHNMGGYALRHRREQAEALAADLNRQDAEGLFDRDLADADISPGVLA